MVLLMAQAFSHAHLWVLPKYTSDSKASSKLNGIFPRSCDSLTAQILA